MRRVLIPGMVKLSRVVFSVVAKGAVAGEDTLPLGLWFLPSTFPGLAIQPAPNPYTNLVLSPLELNLAPDDGDCAGC